MKIINGDNQALGRVASIVAKAALLGEQVAVVNCEKLFISGNRDSILSRQKEMADKKGKPTKGVFYERRPDFFVQRVIKHMLPKNTRGKEAYKKVKCYISVPNQYANAEMLMLNNKKPQKFVYVNEVCSVMGWKND